MKRRIRRRRVVLVVRHVEGQSSSESRAVTQKIAQREPLFFIPRVVCGSASAKCETPGYTQLLSLLFQRRRRRFAKRAGASVAEESCRSLHTRVEMGAGRPVSPSRTFLPLVTGWLGDSDEVRGDFQGPALAGPQRHSTSSQPPDAPWTASGFRGAGGSGRRKARAAGRAEPLPAKQCFSHYLKVPTLNYINYSERYNNLET